MPKMTHPDSKQTIEVTDEQVGVYASQGWQVADSSKKSSTTKKSS